MANMRTINVGSMAPGINNQLPPTNLDRKMPDGREATYLYGADNVDLNEKGYLKRRKGTTTIVVGDTHSLWSDKLGGFVVHEGNLCRVEMQNPTFAGMTYIYGGLPRVPLSYSRGADGDVYWSNGLVIRRVTLEGDAPIATPPPNPVPTVTTTPGGLPKGDYLLAFTCSGSDGESPATAVQRLYLTNGDGFTVEAQQPVNVYLSAPDGDVLTLQASGVTNQNFVGYTQDRTRCMTINKSILQPGNIVRHYRGRMLVAAGSVLRFGDTYNYGLYDPSSGYIPFPEPVTVIEPMDNGVYICADKTYWISDLTNGDLQELLPHGAIFGTSGRSPDNEEAFWQSPNGLIVGDKNSSVKAVQAPALRMGDANSGASLFRQQDGMTHIVSSRTATDNAAVASSFFEARVIQKGTKP